MANKVFSLEINEAHTKIAHLDVKKDNIELLSLGVDNTIPNYFNNPNDKSSKDQALVITQLYKQLNITSTRVNIVIPDSLSYFQLMVMPNLKDDELAKSLKLQIEELVPFPIDDINMAFETVNTLPENKLLLLFIAIQKKIAENIAKTLEYANLEPVSLEIYTSAVGRFLFEYKKILTEPCILINFGYTNSTIYIINPPSTYFVYSRTIKIGLQNFIKDVKLNLNIDESRTYEALRTIGLNNNASIKLYPIIYPLVAELVNEIHNTMMLSKEHFKGTIRKVYLFNYDMNIAALHANLQTLLSMPVQNVQISNLFVQNPITQTFHNNLSAFLPVIAAHIR